MIEQIYSPRQELTISLKIETFSPYFAFNLTEHQLIIQK